MSALGTGCEPVSVRSIRPSVRAPRVTEGAIDKNPELVEADVAFHALVAKAAGNAVLASLLASLATRTMRARLWHGREADGALDETRNEHRRIYEAIMAGDPDLARAAAAAHIASSERWLKGRLAIGRSA